MKLFNLLFCILTLLVLSSAWGKDVEQPKDAESEAAKLISDGTVFLRGKKPLEALAKFDNVLSIYEGRFKDKSTKYFSARSETESLHYLLDWASKDSGAAIVVPYNWAYTHFLKAYTLVELRKIPEAKKEFLKSIAMSPKNSQFLSELGNIYQLEKNWPLALNTYELAEIGARDISPDNLRNRELARAWRGMGYVYVEQNRLDEAEKMYKQCLELNSEDNNATAELNYIQGLKSKKDVQK